MRSKVSEFELLDGQLGATDTDPWVLELFVQYPFPSVKLFVHGTRGFPHHLRGPTVGSRIWCLLAPTTIRDRRWSASRESASGVTM